MKTLTALLLTVCALPATAGEVSGYWRDGKWVQSYQRSRARSIPQPVQPRYDSAPAYYYYERPVQSRPRRVYYSERTRTYYTYRR